MYRVKIKNKKTNVITNVANFKTIALYSAWIDKHKSKGETGKAWGLYYGFRDMAKKDIDQSDLFLIYEEYEKVIEDAWDKPVYETYEDGTIVMEDYSHTDINGNTVVLKRPKQKVVNGEPVFEHVDAVRETWAKLSPQYEIEIVDVTAENEAALAAAKARIKEIKELKKASSVINNWQSLDDIDLPFLKKFFKRILIELK